jgi:thioredoxin 2
MTFSRKVTCPYCSAVDRIPAEQFDDSLQCGSCGRAIFAAKPTDLTAAAFNDAISMSEIPVLVDFWPGAGLARRWRRLSRRPRKKWNRK